MFIRPTDFLMFAAFIFMLSAVFAAIGVFQPVDFEQRMFEYCKQYNNDAACRRFAIDTKARIIEGDIQ